MKLTSIKIMLFGIAIIAFSIAAGIVMNVGGDSFYKGLVSLCATFLPFVGLPICIIGLFMKK